IGDQQLEHHPPREFCFFARGFHFHAGGGMADAGGREHPLALDLHHAGAAIAVGPVPGRRPVAEMRDLDALALPHLPDGLPPPRLDFLAIEEEFDRIAHARPSAKCFSNILTGFIAAWPRPQIEASVITFASSSRSGPSHFGFDNNPTTFSVPTRQGVHWPQLS